MVIAAISQFLNLSTDGNFCRVAPICPAIHIQFASSSPNKFSVLKKLHPDYRNFAAEILIWRKASCKLVVNLYRCNCVDTLSEHRRSRFLILKLYLAVFYPADTFLVTTLHNAKRNGGRPRLSTNDNFAQMFSLFQITSGLPPVLSVN